jgi:hypothetical protein
MKNVRENLGTSTLIFPHFYRGSRAGEGHEQIPTIVQTSWLSALRIWLYNQSFAVFQSLFTVAGETPKT